MNTKRSIARTIVLFSALSLAGVGMAVSALLIPDTSAQMIMVAIGSAIFGAGLRWSQGGEPGRVEEYADRALSAIVGGLGS